MQAATTIGTTCRMSMTMRMMARRCSRCRARCRRRCMVQRRTIVSSKESGGVGLVQSVHDGTRMGSEGQLPSHRARLLKKEAAIFLEALPHTLDVTALSYSSRVARPAPKLAELHDAVPARAPPDHPITLHASLVVVPMASAEVH